MMCLPMQGAQAAGHLPGLGEAWLVDTPSGRCPLQLNQALTNESVLGNWECYRPVEKPIEYSSCSHQPLRGHFEV